VERTFWRLFVTARWRDPKLGQLVGETLEPLSLRYLQEISRIARSTLHRHWDVLGEAGLLQPATDEAEGALLTCIPLIVDRYERRTITTSHATSTPTTPVEPDQLVLFPVEKVGLRGVDNPRHKDPPVPFSPENGSEWDTHSLGSLERSRNVRVVLPENPGDNPESVMLGDLAAADIEDPDVRYLLGKLAGLAEPWRRACENARDCRNLVALVSEHRGPMLQALRQQCDEPTARNPLAWLNRTVPQIAAAGVGVAS